jgi:hypothetical protein
LTHQETTPYALRFYRLCTSWLPCLHSQNTLALMYSQDLFATIFAARFRALVARALAMTSGDAKPFDTLARPPLRPNDTAAAFLRTGFALGVWCGVVSIGASLTLALVHSVHSHGRTLRNCPRMSTSVVPMRLCTHPIASAPSHHPCRSATSYANPLSVAYPPPAHTSVTWCRCLSHHMRSRTGIVP